MDKIIERVQKLLALAGNNPNENEALAALAKAHALLAEHNLSIAEVEAANLGNRESEDQQRNSLNTDTTMPERYFNWIWNAVAESNSCLMFAHRPNPKRYQVIYTMVGRKINIIIATQMALYLCQTMKRLANEHCKQVGRKDFPYKNAYLTGMAARLCQRIREMKSQVGTGLVLWSGKEEEANKAFVADAMGIKLRARRVAKVLLNREGLQRGRVDADKVSLNQQVGSEAKAYAQLAG